MKQYDDDAEKYGYEGEMTTMKCDELKQVEYPIEWGLCYDKYEVDAAIAELKEAWRSEHEACETLKKKLEEIAELKARIQLDDDEMAGFLQLEEECGGGDLRNYIAELKAELAEKDKDIAYWREEYDKETKLTDALKDEIESLKASHYAESVDAGMRERSLRRALWLARAEIAKAMKAVDNLNNYLSLHKNSKWFGIYATRIDTWYYKWDNVERKCRAKAEEYK